MSFITEKNETVQARVENSQNCDDVVKKFDNYRSRAEVIYAEYNEAKLVIDRLRDEINLCQITEKSYSHQISSLKNQLGILEEKRKTFFTLSKKQRVIDERIQKIDERLTQISDIIRELKTNFQNVISTTNKELDLINENRYLKAAVQSREESLKLIKSDMDKLLKEKEELVQQNLSQNSRLSDELKKSRSETDEIRDFCSKSISSYRKQIEKYKSAIEEMEKERRRRLFGEHETNTEPIEAYEPESKEPEQNEKASARPDSTLFPEARGNKSPPDTKDFVEPSSQAESGSTGNGRGSSRIQKTKSALAQPQYPNSSKYRRGAGTKQRAKLEFFRDRGGESSSQPKPKRRLYSENNNHYLF